MKTFPPVGTRVRITESGRVKAGGRHHPDGVVTSTSDPFQCEVSHDDGTKTKWLLSTSLEAIDVGTSRSTSPEDCGIHVSVGDEVILGRHEPVNSHRNWTSPMEDFVGKRARVVSVSTEGRGLPIARVDIDNGRWQWRVRNLRLAPVATAAAVPVPAEPVPAVEHVLNVGDSVILGRHHDGGNWASAMEAYVGRTAKVTRFGAESGPIPCVYVDIDAGAWQWRVRDLTLPAASAAHVWKVGDIARVRDLEAARRQYSYAGPAEGVVTAIVDRGGTIRIGEGGSNHAAPCDCDFVPWSLVFDIRIESLRTMARYSTDRVLHEETLEAIEYLEGERTKLLARTADAR